MEKNIEILRQAQACYMALEQFRRDRDRNKRFNYGDQWSDVIEEDGRMMKEEEYIRMQGSTPLKNNLIRRLVRNVIGVYSSQVCEPICTVRNGEEKEYGEMMTSLLRYNSDLNRLPALYARSLEEFLIGGLIVHRKWYGRRGKRIDCWTDYVHPNNFFIDANMRDFRAWDCTCIGEIHDISCEMLCAQFAHSAEEAELLKGIYGELREKGASALQWHDFGGSTYASRSFLMPVDPRFCRVIEVWRKEWHPHYRCHDRKTGEVYKVSHADYKKFISKKNAGRKDCDKVKGEWMMEESWHYYYLTPDGYVLAQGISPYRHCEHPYVVKAYPLIDGEIHSFVSDVIDQQKYTNRLITQYDWIVKSSAKGVLLVPEDTLPRGCTPDDFADAWNRFNGVLVYKPSARGDIPKQVSCNSTNIGITELLNLQLKFFEDISGVHGALEGKMTNANVSAALFGQQTENATMSLLDLLNTFGEFVRDAANKDLSNMQNFYGEQQVRSIVGDDIALRAYDHNRFGCIDCDLRVTSAIASAKSREYGNEVMKDLLEKGFITMDEYLKAIDYPFAERLRGVK